MAPAQVTLKLSSGSGGVWFLMYVVLDRMAATPVRFHPANLHRKRRDPIRLKAWGFPIPYRGL
jgi:hypothetical protein